MENEGSHKKINITRQDKDYVSIITERLVGGGGGVAAGHK